MSKRSNGAAVKAAPKRASGRNLTEAERAANGYGSVKLRLPQDALSMLADLSHEGGYSRAEVVDSLIRLAWAGTPGRKLRKQDELAAFVARGE